MVVIVFVVVEEDRAGAGGLEQQGYGAGAEVDGGVYRVEGRGAVEVVRGAGGDAGCSDAVAGGGRAGGGGPAAQGAG